jgi:Predicted nucleotide-binding protein containing TIR-like domain
MAESPGGPRRVRVSQADVPRHALGDALKVARCIEDHYAGSAASPLDVATSIGSTPTSSWFRTITGAAIAYGLTTGGPNSTRITLTSLGRRVVAPTDEADDRAATIEALLKPRIVREFLQKYHGKKLPPDHIAQNVLSQLGVDREAAGRTLAVIRESALFAGALHGAPGVEMVDLSAQQPVVTGDPVEAADDPDPAWNGDSQGRSRPIYLGHGRDHDAVKQLQRILGGFGVPYRVVPDEPEPGRPIPAAVRAALRECGSAILVVTRDEQVFDGDGNGTWRPSRRALYELGAACCEYGDRVVVLRERGVDLDSNGLGSIEFDPDGLESRGIDLVRELLALGLVRLTTTG